MDNYYKILNVREDAPQEVIRAAYKALSMVYHPDRNVSDDANEVMQKINVAYSVLSVPEKRKDYDRILLENSFNKDRIAVSQFDKHEHGEEGSGLTEEELKSEILKKIIEQLQKNQKNLKEHFKCYEEVTQQKEQKTFDEESWQQQKAEWDKEHEDFKRRHQEEFRRSRQPSQHEEPLDEADPLCAKNVSSKVNVDFSIAANDAPEAASLQEDKVIQPPDLHDVKFGGSSPLQIKTETKAEVPIVVDDRQEPTLGSDLQNESISFSQLPERNGAFHQEEKGGQHTTDVNKDDAAKHKSESPEKEDQYSGLSFKELRWVIIVAYLIFSYFLITGNDWYTYWTSKPHTEEVGTTKLEEANPTNKAIEELPVTTPPVSERKVESYREKLIRNQVF